MNYNNPEFKEMIQLQIDKMKDLSKKGYYSNIVGNISRSGFNITYFDKEFNYMEHATYRENGKIKTKDYPINHCVFNFMHTCSGTFVLMLCNLINKKMRLKKGKDFIDPENVLKDNSFDESHYTFFRGTGKQKLGKLCILKGSYVPVYDVYK